MSTPRPPTEDEIRDAAQRLGHADENGNYPPGLRNKLAAVVQEAKRNDAAETDPTRGNTAQLLARFADQLNDAGPFRPDTTTALLTEAARFLLRTAGLQLETKETTP